MAKKKTEIQELSEFIRDHMVTKQDLTDQLKAELDPIKKTLAEHTSDLNIIKNDVKTNLDKRLTLEVRVTNIEKESSALHKSARTSSQRQSFPTRDGGNGRRIPAELITAADGSTSPVDRE